MKKYSITIALLLFSQIVFGQSVIRSVISSQGASLSSTSYQVDFTLGQLSTTTISSDELMVNQGFQDLIQDLENTTNITDGNSTLSNHSLYPNPAREQILLKLQDQGVAYEYEIINSLGNKISEGVLTNEHSFDISQYPIGLYFLRLKSSTEQIQTLKIIKQ